MSGFLNVFTSGTDAPGYDVILLAGQSNEVGFGAPTSYPLDNGAARVKQYASSGPSINTVIAANEPLAHPDTSNTGVIGHAVAFANLYVNTVNPNRTVLLVPCAYGGTSFSTGYWQPAGTGYTFAVSQANAAMTQGTGVNRFKGVIWHQGESDGLAGVVAGDYAYYLDQLISSMRASITGASTSWFILGQMVPGYISTLTPTGPAINTVHIDTPNRNLKTAFWYGDTGSGASLHYNAASQRINGASAFAALSSLSTSTVTPNAPTGLSTSLPTSSSMTLSWTAPSSGVTPTNYLVEYALSGSGSWTTFSHTRQVTTSIIVSGINASTAYDFRVSSVSTSGTSSPSSTATATTSSSSMTFDPANKSANITLTSSNQVATSTGGSGFNSVIGSSGKSTGKYYFEFLVSAIVVGQSNFFIPGVGTIQGLGTYLQYPGQWASSIGHQPAATEYTNGFTAANGTNFSLSVNGVIGIAVDFGAGKVWIAYNNNWDTGAHGSNPATGANAWATFTPGPTLYPVIGLYQNNPGNSVTIVSGSSLTYAAPSGFSNWV